MSADNSERLHALDAVRATVLLLGIVFHATLSFLPGPNGIWIVMDTHRSLALAVLFHTLHIFRMATFFLIAGFFAHMSFHKKGARGFIRDRLKRIGIPLIVGWPILFGSIVAATIWGAVVMAHGAKLPPPPKYPGFPTFPLTHLWFLYVLLLLYAATLLVRLLVAALDRAGRLRRGIDAAVRLLAQNFLGTAVVAAPIAAALFLTPHWLAWFGIPTPDSSLVPNLAASVSFSLAFAFGWFVHRNIELLEVWKRRWLLNLVLAIALTGAGFAITGLAPVVTPAPRDDATLLYATFFALSVWRWTFAIIGMALRFLSGYSFTRRYIADASYWLYLVHVPLVMALQVALSQLDWPWFVKFPLILAIAFAILFASYQTMVRYTFIGAILNGRRPPRETRAVPAVLVREPAE